MTYINQVRSRRDQAMFVLLLGFMKKLCWDVQEQKKRTWVPFSVDSMEDKKPKSKTRLVMEQAATYLARGDYELGEAGGLNPNEVERAIRAIQNWKFYFVQNMATKPNKQLLVACQTRIAVARKQGKTVLCTHTPGHLLGKDGASALADNIFRSYYDAEVRAMAEPTMSPYFSREAGPVEFGETLSDEKHLPRQFAEAPTGEFYLTSEDEHAAAWVMSDISEDFASEDEHIPNDEGEYKLIIDVSEREVKYGALLSDMLHASDMDACNAIMARARTMAEAEIIGWWQYSKLRSWATEVVNRRAQEFRNAHAAREREVSAVGVEY